MAGAVETNSSASAPKASPKNSKRKLKVTVDDGPASNKPKIKAEPKKGADARYQTLSDSEKKAIGVLRDLLPVSEERSPKSGGSVGADEDAASTAASSAIPTPGSATSASRPKASRAGSTAWRRKSNCHFCEPLQQNCGLVAGKCPNRPCTICGGRHRLGRCRKTPVNKVQAPVGLAAPKPSPANGAAPPSAATTPSSEGPSSSTGSPTALPIKKTPRRMSKRPDLTLDTSDPALSAVNSFADSLSARAAAVAASGTPFNIAHFSAVLSPSGAGSPLAAEMMRAGLLTMTNLTSPSHFSSLLSPSNSSSQQQETPSNHGHQQSLGHDHQQHQQHQQQVHHHQNHQGHHHQHHLQMHGQHFGSSMDQMASSHAHHQPQHDQGGPYQPHNEPRPHTQHGLQLRDSPSSSGHNHQVQFHSMHQQQQMQNSQHGLHQNHHQQQHQHQTTPPSHGQQQQASTPNSADQLLSSLLLPLSTPSGFNSFPFSFPNTPISSACNTPVNKPSPSNERGLPHPSSLFSPTGTMSPKKPTPDYLQSAAQTAARARQMGAPDAPDSEDSLKTSSTGAAARTSQRKRPQISVDTSAARATGRKAAKKGSPSSAGAKARQYTMLRKRSHCHYCSEIGENCGLVAGKCPNRPCSACKGRHRHGRCRLKSAAGLASK